VSGKEIERGMYIPGRGERVQERGSIGRYIRGEGLEICERRGREKCVGDRGRQREDSGERREAES
jgi:hypothetical protein